MQINRGVPDLAHFFTHMKVTFQRVWFEVATDDLIFCNNKIFIDHVKEICSSELSVEKANRSDDQVNYLDWTFIIGYNNRLYTKLYDKRDTSFTLLTFISF